LRDEPLLQDPLEVQKHFELPSPVLVEKDWYIVRALASITAADVAPFRLVFLKAAGPGRDTEVLRKASALYEGS
jgi:hypothetical protein